MERTVTRRGFTLTLAELFVALLFVWLVSFGWGYWVSYRHSTNFHAGAYNKLQDKHSQILQDFVKIEVRIGILESAVGIEKKKDKRTSLKDSKLNKP